MPDSCGDLGHRDGRVVLGALERGVFDARPGRRTPGSRRRRSRASVSPGASTIDVVMSAPLAAATASAGVVMPTVSSPTMPMTPTENDAAVTRLNDGAAARARTRCDGAALGRAASALRGRHRLGFGSARPSLDRRLAREGEQPGGGLEFVESDAAGRGLELGSIVRRLGDGSSNVIGSVTSTGSSSSNGSAGRRARLRGEARRRASAAVRQERSATRARRSATERRDRRAARRLRRPASARRATIGGLRRRVDATARGERRRLPRRRGIGAHGLGDDGVDRNRSGGGSDRRSAAILGGGRRPRHPSRVVAGADDPTRRPDARAPTRRSGAAALRAKPPGSPTTPGQAWRRSGWSGAWAQTQPEGRRKASGEGLSVVSLGGQRYGRRALITFAVRAAKVTIG